MQPGRATWLSVAVVINKCVLQHICVRLTERVPSISVRFQAQLRGMIGDYSGSDEGVMARALEAFETLSNTLEEYHKGTGKSPAASQQQTSSSMQPARLQPPPGASNPFTAGAAQPNTAAAKKPVDDEPPLITFD